MGAFKIFPCRADKIPLIKNWQQEATDDQEKIKLWQATFNGTLGYWSLPTGPTNNILVLDVDVKSGKNGFESLKGLDLPPTMSQTTKSGGKHFFFKYPNDGKVYGNRAGFLPGLDVRGAGGYVCFYGTDQTPIADAPAWLLQNATSNAQAPAPATIKVTPEIAIAIIQASLESIRQAPDGESNNTLNVEAFRVGQLVASGSVSREYAEAALFRAAKERGKPDYEARRTIESGLNGGGQKPLTSPFGVTEPVPAFTLPPPPMSTRWTPEVITRGDLLNTSKLRKPQLFENWSTEDIHITTADGGTGKTTLKLFEAICLALGESFLGFNCKQAGRTLFITGEDTDKKLAAMLGAIVRQMGLFEEGVDNERKIHTITHSIFIKKDSDLCLIIKDRQNFLHPSQEALRKVLEAVDDIKPKMIVFDPISSFWGSESALNDMAKAVIRFMSELQEKSGACVEMINHMGKQSSATKDMSQFAGRGGTGLPSNSRVCRVFHSLTEEEYTELTGEQLLGHQSAMRIVVNKFTDGSPLYNKPFVVVRDGYLFTRKTLTPAKIKEAERSLTDLERVFSFIKEQRFNDKYPTKSVVIGYFMTCGDPLSRDRVTRSLDMLCYQGHMGEQVKTIENPDLTIKDKVYVVLSNDVET